ncbi:MAG: hydrolase [Sulfurovum sp. PC08-66]|nr:MAG: hydrolase [Sulfurovum sp. PC08-66]KIM12575.1 MAG: hydrolase [Sulfuricurvum sp. PC08-66]
MTTLFFDLDGTLIDSTEAILESFHHTFKQANIARPNDAAILSLIGHPLDVMYGRLGIPEAEVMTFVGNYKNHYRTIATQKTVLLPYAKEAVRYAQTFARLGVVTTKTGEYSRILLQHFGFMDAFEVLIGREDVTQPKPNAEPLLKAMAQLGVTNLNTWLIGDTHLDILCASNAKCSGYAVTSGYESGEVLQKYTDKIALNAFEAVKNIEKITHECKNE